VQELMDAYAETGKIGNITPEDKEDALRIANAIAFKTKEDK
jgi:predicted RNA-binding protein associated with RNAse of E/G family